MKSLKKNFIYNVSYQILALIIPLITVPYVSRVVGVSGIGTYSYTYSVVYYFMIIAMLGLNNYGNRTIAMVRDDKVKLTKTFKEIRLLQTISSLGAIILFTIFTLTFGTKYLTIYLIQSMYLLSCMFDINWFFFGLEEFKKTVIRNAIIKIISLVLIFTLVKSSNDLLIYISILSGSTLLSQLILWIFVKEFIDNKVKIVFEDMKKHIIPCLKLFLPVIAVTIYGVMDKTMLGVMTNVKEVGYYENAHRLINILMSIITALGTVMLPHMSNLYANGKEKESKQFIAKSIKAIMFLAIPMTFGIIAVSKDFSILFFGSEFIKTGDLIILLAVTILFLAWGNVIRTQYLIPREMDKEYIVSAFLGAIVNLIANLLLIPIYKSSGACIGTILAEFTVMFYQTYKVRKLLPLKDYLNSIIPFIYKGLIMMIVILFINYLDIKMLFRVLIQITAGVVIYSLFNLNYIKTYIPHRKKA